MCGFRGEIGETIKNAKESPYIDMSVNPRADL